MPQSPQTPSKQKAILGRGCPDWLNRVPQPLRFITVGAAAAAVHLCVAAVLIGVFNFPPLIGNIGGFLIAFCASYTGHAYWTFSENQNHRTNLPKFFLVALSSFAINELLYFAMLHYLNWHWLPSLIIVLITVAAGTFIISKLWAFAPK